ncbi:MAG TPA: DUF5076 domain-containing protein [Gemmatimonadaceae bacterium]|nr:DUF5076 domain-containing protein [Gemmatimonadaceae bacterium]
MSTPASASRPRQLGIPPIPSADPSSFEVARIWMSGGNQHVALAVNEADDPAAWGIMLADLARHVANAYSQFGTHSKEDAMHRVLALFAAELQRPTDRPTGQIQ